MPRKIVVAKIVKYILVNIYKFWNFYNRFLVGVVFKFLKFICKLHVLLKHLLLLYLKKLIRINMLLSLSTETYMHVAYFVKTLIVTLSKEIDKNK